MPDVYEVPVPFSFHITGAATAGLTALRKVVPFTHEVVGFALSANTAPTGASLILDVVHGVYNTAPASLTTLWPINNGTSGNPDHRPTLIAGNYDMVPVPTTTTNTAPEGTDPPQSGQSQGTSTTTYNYNETPYMTRPDPNPAGYGFAGNSPINEGNVGTVLGTPGVPNAPANLGYVGNPGDAYSLKVIQIGSGTAGSDIELIMFAIPR